MIHEPINRLTDFLYDDECGNAIEAALSPERLKTYRACLVRPDKNRSYQLYMWNLRVSIALWEPLHGLEILIRNRWNRALAEKYGECWFGNASLFENIQARQIDNAKEMVEKQDKDINASNLLPELPFGFWVGLTSRGYEHTLWTNAISKTLGKPIPKRRDFHTRIDKLRTLRNRIAHHEHILSRSLENDFQNILEVTRLICPKTCEWINHHCFFPDALRSQPCLYKKPSRLS